VTSSGLLKSSIVIGCVAIEGYVKSIGSYESFGHSISEQSKVNVTVLALHTRTFIVFT